MLNSIQATQSINQHLYSTKVFNNDQSYYYSPYCKSSKSHNLFSYSCLFVLKIHSILISLQCTMIQGKPFLDTLANRQMLELKNGQSYRNSVSESHSHSARGKHLLIPVIPGIRHVVNFSLFQYSPRSSLITGCPLQFGSDALCDDLLFHLFFFIRIIRVLTFSWCFTRQLTCQFLSVTMPS